MSDPIIVPEPVAEADPSHPRWTPPDGNVVDVGDQGDIVPVDEEEGSGL